MKGGSTTHKFGLWLSSEADYLQIVNEVISKSTSRNINTYTRKKKKNRSKDQKCLMLITRALTMSFRGEKKQNKDNHWTNPINYYF